MRCCCCGGTDPEAVHCITVPVLRNASNAGNTGHMSLFE